MIYAILAVLGAAVGLTAVNVLELRWRVERLERNLGARRGV